MKEDEKEEGSKIHYQDRKKLPMLEAIMMQCSRCKRGKVNSSDRCPSSFLS